MKKIVSLALAALLVFAAIACCFSASAAEKTEPTYPAEESLLQGRTEKFYSNNLTGHSRLANHNYYDDPMVLGQDNTPVTITGIASSADAKYVTILGNYPVDSSASIQSGIFMFPAADGKAPHAFDAVDIYSAVELWDERVNYSTPLETPTGRTFNLVASLKNVTSNLTYTADGTHAFFEFNFPTAVTGVNYLVLAFTEESRATIPLEENGTHIVNMTEFACFDKKIACPDYKTEAKADLLEGLEATFACPSADNNGMKTDLLTDGIIAANKVPSGAVECKYFNKAYGSKDDAAALSYAGVDTKFLYSFAFEGLNGAKVNEFQVVYSAQNDGSNTGRFYNMQHADRQIALLVSSDNGATWTQAYISTLSDEANVIQSSAVTGGKVTSVDDADYCYHIVDITLDKAYENVTNVVLASTVGRTQLNGWASRISEINVFGEKGTAPATTEAQTTEAPEVTTAPEATTEAPTTDAPTTDAPEEKTGCGSVAAIGVAVIVTVLGTAVLRKKD